MKKIILLLVLVMMGWALYNSVTTTITPSTESVTASESATEGEDTEGEADEYNEDEDNEGESEVSLQELLESETPEDLFLAAERPETTTSQLKKLAEVATSYEGKTTSHKEDLEVTCNLMRVISRHPACTAEVLRRFSASPYPEVWEVLACLATDEQTLVRLAKKTASYEGRNTSRSEDQATQVRVARAIASNPSSTAGVLNQFKLSQFKEVRGLAPG